MTSSPDLKSNSLHRSSAEDVKGGTLVDEKSDRLSTSIDIQHGDEALRLIGIDRSVQFSDEYNAKLRRKLDMLIPPLCAAVYFTQFLDKTSLNYASIMGLPIFGQKYNLVSLAFYLGFLVWEFPTVYISQRLRLAKYLGANIIAWGVILMLHAVGTSFQAFFALRFLLGMCEACVAPSLILIVGMFYKKNEQASRIAWFYVMNGLTMIFGGFVAYGITFTDGRVLAPFKVIYILLGGLAILVGICVLIWLPDSPVHARFLTQEERIAALERVRDDQGGTENKTFKRHQMIEAFTDVRTWLVVLSTLLTTIPNGALTNFSNIVIKSFGYTSKQALILGTPAGAVAAVSTLFVGWYSDKTNERMLPMVFCLVPTIVGSAMLIGLNGTSHKGALLFAIYIVGTFGSALSLIYAYNASNTSGHTKKSTVNAMTLVAFSVGNMIGTEIFQPKNAPAYIPGKVTIMVVIIVQLFLSFVLRWVNLRLNKRKQEQIAELMSRKGWSEADVQRERDRHAFADLTDKENVYFVYTA
ncbi:MFS general substrate transporter [Pluteus cervinus]|uniref:MFS general substrate transporter n=1 Tax=Pluteus cervinus TaxID=181527 RepID=A0ACD3B5I8_9AGAR|nr:MFS general substrate transporter [Pluteus cervinus]